MSEGIINKKPGNADKNNTHPGLFFFVLLFCLPVIKFNLFVIYFHTYNEHDACILHKYSIHPPDNIEIRAVHIHTMPVLNTVSSSLYL